MARSPLPCGIAPSSDRPYVRTPPRPARQRPAAPAVVLPRPAPRGPLLLGPGRVGPTYVEAQQQRVSRFPEAVLARYKQASPPRPAVIDMPVFQPTASQEKRLAEILDGAFDRHSIYRLLPGFLPLRVDAHPDGRVRLVYVNTGEVPDTLKPGREPLPVGYLTTRVFDPEYNAAKWGWRGEPTTKYDPDPAWFQIRDVRWAPPDGKTVSTYHTTLEQFVDASGFKQPAKLREVRSDHWSTVANLLRHRRPVAFEVLDDYPALAQFFAENLAAAKTVAEIHAERDAADNPDDPDITVHWSVQNGLLLYTRGKEEKIIAAIRAVRGRGMGFKWSSNLGAWYRPQSVGVSESTVDIDRVARALREQGMVVAVERGEAAKSLGDANTRRQEHKFWRAEGYAGRAETATERAAEAEARAAEIRSQVPVGAATRRAERMEARADRAEGQAAEHLQYVEHAASAAQNLAATAAGYDTTVEITRKQAEKRADAFAQLFVRKVKGATGATKLYSDKKDNLSEYRLTWVVLYPKMAARVVYDGRAIVVEVWPEGSPVQRSEFHYLRGAGSPVRVLTKEVTNLDAEAVYALAIEALPKVERVKTDEGAEVFSTAGQAQGKLSKYAKARTAAAFRDVFVPAQPNDTFSARREYLEGIPGQPLVLAAVFGRGEYVYVRRSSPMLALVPDGTDDGSGPPTFTLRRLIEQRESYGPVGIYTRDVLKESGRIPLDFTGMTVAEAWAGIVAAGKALLSGRSVEDFRPKVPKAAKPRAVRAPTSKAGTGTVEVLPREMDATARARAADLTERLAPVTQAASERLAELRSAQDDGSRALVAQAREAGKALAFYPTPPALAEHVVGFAQVAQGDRVLEPSAGMGALVGELVRRGALVTAIEAQPDRAAYLSHTYGHMGVNVGTGDFLAMSLSDPNVPPEGFDAVVMNPPFGIEGKHHLDAEHVTRALSFVRPGGTLVAIMSPGSVQPTSARRENLHASLVGWEVMWEPVDAKRFRISGTDTPTVILVARRPKANRRLWR